MAISYVASAFAANTNATDATSVTVTKPTGTADGDLMIAIISGYDAVSMTGVPSGWSVLGLSPTTSGTNLENRFYYKVASGEGANYTWTWSGAGGSISAVHITLRGQTVDWIDHFAMSATADTTTDPVVTTSLSIGGGGGMGGLGLSGSSFRVTSGAPTATGGGSWTEIQDFVRADGGAGTNIRGQAVYRLTSNVAPGGSTGTNSIDLSATPAHTIKWSMIFPDTVQVTSGASAMAGWSTVSSGTSTVRPAATGASALSGFSATSSGTATLRPAASGASALSGFSAASSGSIEVTGTFLQMKVDGEWVDITPKLRHEQGVTIVRGKSSSGSQTTTTTCSFTLDNREHEFNPFNVNGEYYGALDRNTEIRLTKQEVGVRFWGEIGSFEFVTDQSGNDLSVNVECGGLLRRLEQGDSEEKSALRREIVGNSTTYSLVNYWPMEEEGGTGFANVAPARSRADRIKFPLSINQLGEGYLEFQSYSAAECSEAIPQIGLSRVQSRVYGGNPTSNDGMTFTFFLASPGGITASTELFRVSGTKADGTTGTLYLTYTGTDTYSFNYSSPGSSASVGSLNIPTVGKKGVMFFVSIGPNVAGTAKMKLWYQGVTDLVPIDICVPIGSTDVVDWASYSATINNGMVALNEASSVYIGHVAAWEVSDVPSSTGNTAVDLPTFNSLDAYLGENAATRFGRTCTEEGVDYEIYGPLDTPSQRMGYQKPSAFLSILRECEETDGGILYELRDSFGLGYRPLATMYNQDAVVELDYEGGHLLNEFKPKYDDQDLVNDATVTRDGGSSARYEITSGRMSTDPSPDGIGSHPAADTLSLYRDEDCYPQAGWRAYKGSVREIRVTKLATGLEVPNVAEDDVLKEALLTVDLGDRMTVDNCPSWLGARYDLLDQVLDGYTERWDPTEHRWAYNTSPASVYAVARAKPVVGDGLRVGLQPETYLNTAVGTAATTLDVITTVEDNAMQGLLLMTTTQEPFDIEIGGERITVTNVVDAGNFGVSFVGHRWTLTVTRSVNGVVKAHSDGASTLVRLWDRPIVAL